MQHTQQNNNTTHTHIFTISELTAKIKSLLEQNFPIIWIVGEISNFSKPASGHYYFSLKDNNSQINSVMFRGNNRRLKFNPDNGMLVTGLGRISVYEPRGTYQLIIEHLEPHGVGALQIAFEQLKTRLTAEGLFDDQFKKPIPYFPKKICVITSATGSVVHDIINIIHRRFPGIHLTIMPTKVQGIGAVEEITNGISCLNNKEFDVAILARGGGSLEDLSPFNSEEVARAVFNSQIPIISAVGHETDYTIADFVSDLRAPTPSAAAELVVPLKRDLEHHIHNLTQKISQIMDDLIKYYQLRISETTKRLIDPKKHIDDLRFHIEDMVNRITRLFLVIIRQKQKEYEYLVHRLSSNSPFDSIVKNKERLEQISSNLLKSQKILLFNKRSIIREIISTLNTLNPASIINRGYSLTRKLPEKTIVKNSEDVSIGQKLEILVANGKINCKVEEKISNGSKKNI